MDATNVLPPGALQQSGASFYTAAAGVVGDAVLEVLQLGLHGAVAQCHDADRDDRETHINELLPPVETRQQCDHWRERADRHEDPGPVTGTSSQQQVDQDRPDPQVGVPHHRACAEPHAGAGQPEPNGVGHGHGPGQGKLKEGPERGQQMCQRHEGEPGCGESVQTGGEQVLNGSQALQGRDQPHAEPHEAAHSSGWFLKLHRRHFPTGAAAGWNMSYLGVLVPKCVVSKLWPAPNNPE